LSDGAFVIIDRLKNLRKLRELSSNTDSQSSEYFLIKNSLLRALRGEISEFLYQQIELDIKRPLTIILMISSLAFFLGCSESLTTTEKGAIIGTGAGASLGAVIGSATGHAGVGAGVGAVVGLVGGALIGDQIQERQKQEQELQQQMAAQQAQIDRAEQELQQLKQQVEAR
jgi:outer membrane protein with glycine zipper